MIDSHGSIANSYQYDAFGNTLEANEKVHNRFRYSGEQFDSGTNQYYLRARFYNPSIGRFTQEDVYRGDGLNLYAYVANNPINYVDPSGFGKQKENTYETKKRYPYDLEATNKYAGYIRANYNNPNRLTFDEFLKKNPKLNRTHSEYVETSIDRGINGIAIGMAFYEIAALAKPAYDYYAAKSASTVQKVNTVLAEKIAPRINNEVGSVKWNFGDVGKATESAGGTNTFVEDLSHVTGKTAMQRNKAIDSIIKEDLSNINFRQKPQYSPFSQTGIAQEGSGTHIGKKSFSSRTPLRDTIIHEELHQRWWERGIYDHHPVGTEKEAQFYKTIERYFRMRDWEILKEYEASKPRLLGN